MSAVNNDVGAIAALSFLIYAMTCIGKYGINWQRLALALAALLLCLVVKLTTWFAIPLECIGMLRFAWGSLPQSAKIALIILFIAGVAASIVWHPYVGVL